MGSPAEKLKQIIQLDQDLQKIQDLDILMEKILLYARIFTKADAGTIYLRKENKLDFSFAQNDTQAMNLPKGQKLMYSFFSVDINEKSIAGYVAVSKKMLNIDDVYKIDTSKPYVFNSKIDKVSRYRTKSMLTLPLLDQNEEVLGVLQVINAKNAKGHVLPFNKSQELYVQHFANSASMALQRAKLTRQIILRMISMAELRDPKETGPHVNRVAAYAVELYERWAFKKNLPEHEIDRNRDILRMAAMLHDVGKVGISDIILKKPGRFTDDEYSVMKSHTYCGASLFKSKQSDFDEMAQSVALTHHENWDGTGYPGLNINEVGDGFEIRPNGLRGEEIPIFGRIVSIADVFDALSCRRVYKEAWTEEQVLEEIRKSAGTKFDPELVEIFFEIIEHLRVIQSRYPDLENVAKPEH